MKFTYKGKKLIVGWDKNICTHSGKCAAGLPTVFDVKKIRGFSQMKIKRQKFVSVLHLARQVL